MKDKENGVKGKLSPCSLGFGIGLAEALYLIVFAWVADAWGYGSTMIESVAHMFHGYAATFFGGIIGGIWGFVDGFIFGFLVALFYNLCHCCCRMCMDCWGAKKGRKSRK